MITSDSCMNLAAHCLSQIITNVFSLIYKEHSRTALFHGMGYENKTEMIVIGMCDQCIDVAVPHQIDVMVGFEESQTNSILFRNDIKPEISFQRNADLFESKQVRLLSFRGNMKLKQDASYVETPLPSVFADIRL